MSGRAMGRQALAALVVAVLPSVGYAALVATLRVHGGATVMLGAAAGTSGLALAVTGAALVLRLYTMVAMPGVLVGWAVILVARAWRLRVRRRSPG